MLRILHLILQPAAVSFPSRGRLPNSPLHAKQLSERAGSRRCLRARGSQARTMRASKNDARANKFNAQNKKGEHKLSQYRYPKNFPYGSFLEGVWGDLFSKKGLPTKSPHYASQKMARYGTKWHGMAQKNVLKWGRGRVEKAKNRGPPPKRTKKGEKTHELGIWIFGVV